MFHIESDVTMEILCDWIHTLQLEVIFPQKLLSEHGTLFWMGSAAPLWVPMYHHRNNWPMRCATLSLRESAASLAMKNDIGVSRCIRFARTYLLC